MASGKRREGESFEDYRKRLKKEQKDLKEYLRTGKKPEEVEVNDMTEEAKKEAIDEVMNEMEKKYGGLNEDN